MSKSGCRLLTYPPAGDLLQLGADLRLPVAAALGQPERRIAAGAAPPADEAAALEPCFLRLGAVASGVTWHVAAKMV